ncbi:MAG TPA: hypothetical protein VGT24_01700 [Candidatus Acidoferrales bacterium]|nr:hypothetical protein [Candidatus Acidoferrales bacterium]
MRRPYQFNDPEERRHNRLAFCVGLVGFWLALAVTILYELAKAVMP